jgi:hypothetical protein
VGYTDRQCHSFLESFFTARSASQVSEMSLVTGRYLSVASMRTISPANFFTFAQVPVFSSQKKYTFHRTTRSLASGLRSRLPHRDEPGRR